MSKTLFRNIAVVNEGKVRLHDVLVVGEKIDRISDPFMIPVEDAVRVVDGTGRHLFPGVIDDQVHFREPGLTHKGEIYTEAKAAVSGGITSFMEMPNTIPNALTQSLLEEKFDRAAHVSLANYSFFMGASNDNLQEVMKTDPKRVCGVKVFMGSSTGDMLVDDRQVLDAIFADAPVLVATHCEDEKTVRANLAKYKELLGDALLPIHHPMIRSEEACYRSSSLAVELAARHNTRLHILHISTAKEISLFRNDIPLTEKRITAEACIHHLWFSDEDYARLGNFIKWNPAIKTSNDRAGIMDAVLNGYIDVIATDHAPHTLEEKNRHYLDAPSGGPLVQHALVAMLEFYHRKKISLPQIADKMSHAVARCFNIANRGFIKEGFQADLVVVNLQSPWTVSKNNVLAKCGWSPFEGQLFSSSVEKTFVNGHLVYDMGQFDESTRGQRLLFDR